MECCTIHCALPARKHSASRGRRLSRLSVSRSSRAPPSGLIVPPSKRATISREPHPLNPKLDWIHSVIAKAAPFLALTASVETQLCQKERLFASLFCEKCGLTLAPHRKESTCRRVRGCGCGLASASKRLYLRSPRSSYTPL